MIYDKRLLTKCVLARMSKKWTSPVCVFFKPTPEIKYKDGHCCHVFECAAGSCKGKNSCYVSGIVSRFLDKGDANSTGNLLRHARICWGTDVVAAATATKDIHTAHEVLANTKLCNSSILAEFQCAGKGEVSYQHTQHTKAESRCVPLRTPFIYFLMDSAAHDVERRLSAGSAKVKGHSRS